MAALERTSLLRRMTSDASDSSGARNLGFERGSFGSSEDGFFDWVSFSRAEESMVTFERRQETA